MSPETPTGWPRGFAAGPADREALLLLAHAGLTPRRLHALAWAEGSASACRRAVERGAVGDACRDALRGLSRGEALRAVEASGARLVVPGDRGYPGRLLDLPDPPAALFVRGRPLPDGPAASIVGARGCSAYGREVATALGRGLAAAGVCVVSGAARGVDEAAHRGALAADGPTVAVLGSGIDVAYPASNRRLLERIARHGTLVSEYPPGTPAAPWRFPARNRIVAALGLVAVIVEGASGSGSMITAEFALDLGRDVLAVPGAVTSPLSEVPHALLREGAGLVRGPDDVLAALGLPERGAGAATEALPDVERRVLERVAGEPVTCEWLAGETGLPTARVLSALVALELKSLVSRVGGRYARRPR